MTNSVNDAGKGFEQGSLLPLIQRFEAVSSQFSKRRRRRSACGLGKSSNVTVTNEENLRLELERVGIADKGDLKGAQNLVIPNSRWYVKELNFYWLEETSTFLVQDRSKERSSILVRDCGKCGSRQELPACRRCGSDRFGVFRIRGNMHGIFCKECSLGVDRWECSGCHTNNLCDHTIKQLVKERPQQEVSSGLQMAAEGNGSSVWNYLFALIIFLLIAYQILPTG